MRIGCYVDTKYGKRMVRFVATNEEYQDLALQGKFDLRVSDKSNLYLVRASSGGTFNKKGGVYIMQLTRNSSLKPFASTDIPVEDMGDKDSEIVAMIDLAKLNPSKPNQAYRRRSVTERKPSEMSNPHRSQVAGAIIPNAKILRQVHELLGDHFDERKSRYLDSYSDERIAREANCSVDFVVKQRKEAYGELAPPVDVSVLSRELGILRTIRSSLNDQVNVLDKSIARLSEALEELKKTG